MEKQVPSHLQNFYAVPAIENPIAGQKVVAVIFDMIRNCEIEHVIPLDSGGFDCIIKHSSLLGADSNNRVQDSDGVRYTRHNSEVREGWQESQNPEASKAYEDLMKHWPKLTSKEKRFLNVKCFIAALADETRSLEVYPMVDEGDNGSVLFSRSDWPHDKEPDFYDIELRGSDLSEPSDKDLKDACYFEFGDVRPSEVTAVLRYLEAIFICDSNVVEA